jgi:hypothetical protein
MSTPNGETPAAVEVPFGAWFDPRAVRLDFPPGWRVERLDPDDAPALDDAALARAFAAPVGSPSLRELARGRRRALIAIDDLTRPTPTPRILPAVVRELEAGGLASDAVQILVGTAAHRPMSADEVARKLGPELAGRVSVSMHDFMGPDVRFAGWLDGGPVHLNRHFLDADLKIVVGSAVPHNETGFGGGAKMVVPGVAGRRTIAHFHGALPPRPVGQLEPDAGRRDRRAWSEAVARPVGVAAAVCAAVNARAEVAALVVGDVVEAQRAAARRALAIGRTPVPRELAAKADVVVVNAFPLDTDPIQMAKSLTVARKFPGALEVCVNAASDGIFYHGMGMGSGLHPRRLAANLPRWLASPGDWWAWLRGLAVAAPRPALTARVSYFHLNALAWSAFQAGEGAQPPAVPEPPPAADAAGPLVWSPGCPAWGFRRRYRGGRLFPSWSALRDELARRHPHGLALVLPCAPIQIPEWQ